MWNGFCGKVVVFAGALMLFLAGCGVGRQTGRKEKTLMHVFAYTPLDNATQQDFMSFENATGDMVGKIPGLRRVWVGKLREPVPAENDRIRTYGVAMEFDDLQALEVYAGHPVHTDWVKVYERVRQRGTTTLDIMP
ncbi:MAG: Dabb family protein [Acidobacteria bacterium]|nr:Dabb family protein [Acidobacteriota bacterium]